jgi:hypothetical protein
MNPPDVQTFYDSLPLSRSMMLEYMLPWKLLMASFESADGFFRAKRRQRPQKPTAAAQREAEALLGKAKTKAGMAALFRKFWRN